MKKLIIFTVALLTAAPSWAETAQPYSGLEARDIANLSQADVTALLAGEGWGLALPAELNGYPGPAHVLEAADVLGLTDDQKALTQAIFDAMNTEARQLGTQYVAVERHLSGAFREGELDAGQLKHMTAMAGETLGKLRAVHLTAHLEMKVVLSEAQVAEYILLRGYADTASGHDSNEHTGH